MPRMPGALWRPLPHNGQKMLRHDILCEHTMVGSLWGTDSYFRGMAPGGTASHFGTGPDGDIVQWIDTAYWAWANYSDSGRIVSVENADYGTGFPAWNTNDASAVPAFTAAQVESNAEIVKWVAEVHDIPPVLIPDSGLSRRGVGYHRLGVPGYMKPGTQQWSRYPGKSCPGPKRIAQMPQIVARAKELLGGDVPLTSEEIAKVAEAAATLTVRKLLDTTDLSPEMAGHQSVRNVLSQVWTNSREDLADNDALVAAVKQLPANVRAALADAIVQVDVSVAQGEQPPPAA